MFACIYIPDFPVEAIVRAEPILCRRAIAILEGKPPLTRVVALNERARFLGLEAGMTKLQATAFAESTEACKYTNLAQTRAAKQAQTAVLRQRSRTQEDSAHLALLDVAYSFTPRVEDTATDTLLLELSGFERLYGSAATMGGDLASRV